MSLVFNDTTNLSGLVQQYEREIGVQVGHVSGDATRLKQYVADVNLALDDFTSLAIQSSGTWQFDDSNHTDYPIIRANIESGRRDYTVIADKTGNIALDFHRVRLADASGNYSDITPRDMQSQKDSFDYFDTATGVAKEYDKTGNGLILGTIPNYDYPFGLEVYINREASYFTTSDTTKKPGVPGIFHRYFAVKPAYDYARRERLENTNALLSEVLRIEADAKEYFSARPRDERPRLTVGYQNNR